MIAIAPVFLLGALAVRVRADLDFGPGTLGALVFTFFTCTALGSVLLGRGVQRYGSSRALVLVCLSSAVVFATIALSQSIVQLFIAFVLAGLGNAAAQPAVNLALTQVVRHGRLGLAFGIKQASVPLASLLGGLAVPTVGVMLGWRWAFGLAALASGVCCVNLWRRADGAVDLIRPAAEAARGSAVMPTTPLIILTAGGMLAAASATSIGAFLVDSGVATGLPEASVGVLFAVASLTGLASRIGLGWYVDTATGRGRLGLVAALLSTGSAAYLLLAVGNPVGFAAGAIIGYAAGWGWPGVYHYVIVTGNAEAPATATGVAQSGTSLGAGLGPMAFGLVAERWSYGSGWVLAAVLAATATVVIIIGRSTLQRWSQT